MIDDAIFHRDVSSVTTTYSMSFDKEKNITVRQVLVTESEDFSSDSSICTLKVTQGEIKQAEILTFPPTVA